MILAKRGTLVFRKRKTKDEDIPGTKVFKPIEKV